MTMGIFNVHFTFKAKDDKLLDFLIDWYVRRGMDCTAGVGGDGTGSADIDKKYLAAFCMIDKIAVTSVQWDKAGVTAWRPKRKIARRMLSRQTPQINGVKKPSRANRKSSAMKPKSNGHTI